MRLGDLFKFGGGKKTIDIRANNAPVGPNYTAWDAAAGRNVPWDVHAYNRRKEAELRETNKAITRDKNWFKAHQAAVILGLGGAGVGALMGGGAAGAGAAAGGSAGGAPAAGSMAGMSLGKAGPFVAPALGKVGGAVAPAAATGVGAAGGGLSLGSVLKLGELAAGIWGVRSGRKAESQTQAAVMAENQRQFDLQHRMMREQEATRQAELQRYQAEMAAQWAAQQKMAEEAFRAQEEERIYQRRLREESEARKGPRRQASADALVSLRHLIGRG